VDNKQKAFIVTRIARFEPPHAIRAAYRAVYGDELGPEVVTALDPQAGATLSFDLWELFQKTRSDAITDPASAPFAEQKARLIVLSNMARWHNDNNEPAAAANIIRQIAEELGVVGSGAKAKAAGAAADETKEILTAITRTIIEPTKRKDTTE
jgi:hypothetical protein